jgi:hypothetical protein
MDVSATGAIDNAVAAAGTGSSIAISVLSSTEKSQAQNIATLFSSLGLGRNFSATA